jgi:hypothetical protein
MVWLAREAIIERQGPGTNDQEEYQTQQHAKVCAGFVHHRPEP